MLGLTLVSAPHLARSYHHLFPLDAFQEISLEEHNGERYMSFDQFISVSSGKVIFKYVVINTTWKSVIHLGKIIANILWY